MRLIDADELKIDYGFTWDDITITHDELYALIDRQPTIEAVQERNGRWIRKKEGKIKEWCCSCSECGAHPLKTVYGQHDALSEYCPHCGAYMEGAEEK